MDHWVQIATLALSSVSFRLYDWRWLSGFALGFAAGLTLMNLTGTWQ